MLFLLNIEVSCKLLYIKNTKTMIPVLVFGRAPPVGVVPVGVVTVVGGITQTKIDVQTVEFNID